MSGRAHIVNHRMPGESFKAYRQRRKSVQHAIDVHCKGRMAHKACDVVSYPALGVDLKLDSAITKDLERGLLRDLVPVTLKNGTIRRFGRTKGVTFLSKSKIDYPNMKRRERREIRIGE